MIELVPLPDALPDLPDHAAAMRAIDDRYRSGPDAIEHFAGILLNPDGLFAVIDDDPPPPQPPPPPPPPSLVELGVATALEAIAADTALSPTTRKAIAKVIATLNPTP